ncbi:MAG: acyl carrier protein [Anaerolineae bacterium]
MTQQKRHPMTLEEFRDLMAEELGMDKEQLTPDASFYELMVDSIRMVEMLLRFEEQGIEIPLETAWQIETVGDAYRLYQESLLSASRPVGPWGAEAKRAGQ